MSGSLQYRATEPLALVNAQDARREESIEAGKNGQDGGSQSALAQHGAFVKAKDGFTIREHYLLIADRSGGNRRAVVIDSLPVVGTAPFDPNQGICGVDESAPAQLPDGQTLGWDGEPQVFHVTPSAMRRHGTDPNLCDRPRRDAVPFNRPGFRFDQNLPERRTDLAPIALGVPRRRLPNDSSIVHHRWRLLPQREQAARGESAPVDEQICVVNGGRSPAQLRVVNNQGAAIFTRTVGVPLGKLEGGNHFYSATCCRWRWPRLPPASGCETT